MGRKTPVLLRRAPLSGAVNVLTNYARKSFNDSDVIDVRSDGKHDVTAAFYALMLEELFDGKEHEGIAGKSTPGIIAILDGAADGDELSEKERAELRAFRERLIEIVNDHNARIDSGELAGA